MARDYKKEYEQDKQSLKTVITPVRIPKQLAEDFSAKVEQQGTTKNKVIREFIESYTYGKK